MPRLMVEAAAAGSMVFSEGQPPAAGEDHNADIFVTVSVTDGAGMAVTDLEHGNFRFLRCQGQPVEIDESPNQVLGGDDGLYEALIERTNQAKRWPSGDHVFAVIVTRATVGPPIKAGGLNIPAHFTIDRGQSLFEVTFL